MEGTRHPHQAMQPMSPVPSWQQQQYQQSGQQYQEPRLGQPYQQPRLGQQYQQPRFPQNYQQLEFEQQHHSGLGQQYQQSGLLSLPQELGLAQFQPMGFGRQHQQPRLVQPRPSEEFPHIFQHLQKQQQSQHTYDDKQLGHVSQRVSIEDQQRSITPNPEQQKEAEIMSLWKDLQHTSKKSVVSMHPSLDIRHNEEAVSSANYSAQLSPYSQSTIKDTEPTKGLMSQERPVDMGINIPIGLHCIPPVSRSSIDDVNLSNMAPLELSVNRHVAPLPTSSGLIVKPLSLKTSHSLSSSHDFTRCDFSDIANLSSGMNDPPEGQPGNPQPDDYSRSAGHLDPALHRDSRPLIREKNAELHHECNPPPGQLETAACDDSNMSDNQLVSAVPDDSNPSDSQLDSAVPDDSNLSDDQLDTAARDYSNPSVDQLDSIVRDDSNQSVDPLDSVSRDDSSSRVHSLKTEREDCKPPIVPLDIVVRNECSSSVDPLQSVHDDSNPLVDPLDSVVRDDSNPSVDQLESTLCSDTSYPVGSSKGHSRCVSMEDSGQSDAQGSVLPSGANVPHKQTIVSSGGSSSSNAKLDAALLDNSGSAINLSKGRSRPEFLNSSAGRLESDGHDGSYSSERPLKGGTLNALRDASISSGCQESPIINYSSYSRSRLREGSPQSDPQTRAEMQDNSNSSDNLPKNSVKDNSESISDNAVKTSVYEGSKASSLDNQHRTLEQENSKSEMLDTVPRTSRKQDSSQSGIQISATEDSNLSDDQHKTEQFHTAKSPDSQVVSPSHDDSHSLDSQARRALPDDSNSSDKQEALHAVSSSSNDQSESTLLNSNLPDVQTNSSGSPVETPENETRPKSPGKPKYRKDLPQKVPDTTLSNYMSPSHDSSSNEPSSFDEKDTDKHGPKITKGLKPAISVRQVLDDSAHSPLETEKAKNINTTANLSVNADGGFHFVEIQHRPTKASRKMIVDPLPEDPFNNLQSKSPRRSVTPEDIAVEDDADVQRLPSNKKHVQEISANKSIDSVTVSSSDVPNNAPNRNSGMPEVLPSQDNDAEELLVEEDGLLDDDDTTHFFEENHVYVGEEHVEATCHVCESNVKCADFKSHLFFGHLQCAYCNRRLVGCDMLQDLEDPKKAVCKKSTSGRHSFKNWTLDPIEFLAYYIRKELVIKKFCAGLSGPPSAAEIVEEIESYMAKLASLEDYAPWKAAIMKCHKYTTDRKSGKSTTKQPINTTTKPTVIRTSATTGRSSEGSVGRPSSTYLPTEKTNYTPVRSTNLSVNLPSPASESGSGQDYESEKSKRSGTVLLHSLSAGLKKTGRYETPSPKKQTKPLKICSLKNIVVQAPINGNYLVVHFPSQPCPENCPNCYCQFDPSAVTVNCVTSVITNKCENCDLTIFVLQDPPDGSVQNVKFRNKRKAAYKFTGPESKKKRMQ